MNNKHQELIDKKVDELIEKVKHVIYLGVLPIYLWSIGFKTLEEYIQALFAEEEVLRNIRPVISLNNIT